jgi:hypothetical protein
LATPLHPNEIPDGNWTTISTNIIGPLPEAHGYNAINVIMDRKSKLRHFIPTTIELSSLGQAKIYRDHIFRLHGIPQKIISDRGPQYVSKFMGELYQLLDIKGGYSTAFHPQTDGQTEQLNQELEIYLCTWTSEQQDDWDEWLPLVEFTYNN